MVVQIGAKQCKTEWRVPVECATALWTILKVFQGHRIMFGIVNTESILSATEVH